MTLTRPALFALLSLAALVLFVASPSSAEGLAKGSNILSVELTTGTADLVAPESLTPGAISAYDHSEWGGGLQFQRLLSENWALAISGGVGTFKETDEFGTNAPPATPDFKYSQSSWNVRVGADYFAHISPNFHLFVGPGIQYWVGHDKWEQDPNSVESEDTKRWALNGRMGAHVALGGKVALEGHLGHYFGHASATDTGAKASWSPSGIESAVGFAFTL